MLEINQALKFAKKISRQAGFIMRQQFSLKMKKEWKNDNTPLTETDKEINDLVLDAIERAFPRHSIIAEEGNRLKQSEYVWVCDPVDGTIPFSHGYPTFAFSLALTKNGESVLGVIYDPILDRLLHAEKGTGAFLNDQKISVSTEHLCSRALIECNLNKDIFPIRQILMNRECYIPTFYSCVYAGMLVAAGEFVATIYAYDKPWDCAAVKIIVEEAGGKVTNLKGLEQRYDGRIDGFVASNGVVHDELIHMIGSVFKET